MNWLVASLVLSVVLTIGLNLAVRSFPNAPRRMTERVDDRRRVQVFFPWKAMLLGSIVLTVIVNLVAALAR